MKRMVFFHKSSLFNVARIFRKVKLKITHWFLKIGPFTYRNSQRKSTSCTWKARSHGMLDWHLLAFSPIIVWRRQLSDFPCGGCCRWLFPFVQRVCVPILGLLSWLGYFFPLVRKRAFATALKLIGNAPRVRCPFRALSNKTFVRHASNCEMGICQSHKPLLFVQQEISKSHTHLNSYGKPRAVSAGMRCLLWLDWFWESFAGSSKLFAFPSFLSWHFWVWVCPAGHP